MGPSSFLCTALALLIVGVAAAPAGQQKAVAGQEKRWDQVEPQVVTTTYYYPAQLFTTTMTVTTTVTAPASAPTPTATATGSFLPANFTETGITGFLGKNTGIASWFRTNNGHDFTNGHSWCGSPYDNSVPGFAPSVDTMLQNFGNDWQTAATAYCGLEAIFTTPSGLNATLYLVDGFADPWVLTPGSIDVVTGSYPLLRGYQTDSKNDVVQDVTWRFTGRRNEQYKFKGVGSG